MKNIVIVGGNGLIGSEISKRFADFHNVIVIDKNYKKKISNRIFFFKGDICNEKKISNLFKKIFTTFKKIDAVINLSYPKNKKWGKKFENIQSNDLKENLFNQLGSTIILAKIVTKYFTKQKFGNLILFSSIQGLSAPKFDHYVNTEMVSPIEYSAAKAGIINITRYLAKYFKGKNVRINCISPGGINDSQPISFKKRYKNSCLSKGLLDPKDIFGIIEYLISDSSKYINGQNIVVDDGWSL